MHLKIVLYKDKTKVKTCSKSIRGIGQWSSLNHICILASSTVEISNNSFNQQQIKITPPKILIQQ